MHKATKDRAGIRAPVCPKPGSVPLGTILPCPLPSLLGRQEMELGGGKMRGVGVGVYYRGDSASWFYSTCWEVLQGWVVREGSSDPGVPPGATPEPLPGAVSAQMGRECVGGEGVPGSCARFGPGLVEQSRLRCRKQWPDPTPVLTQHGADSETTECVIPEAELLRKGPHPQGAHP